MVRIANNRGQAYSWPQAKRLCRQLGYNEKVEVSKNAEPFLPPEFEQSALSIPAGAKAVYRDQRARDSYQIREYEDHWTIEMDRHNPEEGNAVAHAVFDAPIYTASAAVAGSYLAGLWG